MNTTILPSKTGGYAKRLIKVIAPEKLITFYRQYKKREASQHNSPNDSNSKKIAFIEPNYTNDYIPLMKSAINQAGYEVTDNPEGAKYIWLHWYENISSTDEFLEKISNIKLWKQRGHKIIYQIHNKKPHETPVPQLAKALMVALADAADIITIHSSETLSIIRDLWDYDKDFKNVVGIPLPNYIDMYGEKIQTPTSLTNDTLRILFFGIVRPYKGIENLIEATRGLKNISISIYGLAADSEYRDKLLNLVKNRKDITSSIEYVDDNQIPRLLSEHHLVVLPYLLKSALNSSAAILAFSYGRTVLGSNNGTLKDMPSDLYFGYNYGEENEHTKQLRNSILELQEGYNKKYNTLIGVGERAYDFVKDCNGIDKVAIAINKMIEQLN